MGGEGKQDGQGLASSAAVFPCLVGHLAVTWLEPLAQGTPVLTRTAREGPLAIS